MPDWSYHPFFKPLLFRLPPERARDLTLGALGGLARLPWGASFIETIGNLRPEPALRREVMGISFPSPVGLGAGLDPHALAPAALARLGFGYLEYGPVTREPVAAQASIERRSGERAIWYPNAPVNDGVDALCARLGKVAPLPVPLGFRLACDPGATSAEASAECAELIVRLSLLAAFYTLETHLGRASGAWSQQAWEAHLASVLVTIQQCATGSTPRPLLLNLAPDIDLDRVEALVAPAVALGVCGVVIAGGIAAEREGRLVGAPTRARSLEMVRALHARWGDQLTIIASGGIEQPDDALRLLAAGAALVQIHSGLVYAGPGLARRINDAVAFREAVDDEPSPSATAALSIPEVFRAGWIWTALLGAAMIFGGLAAWLIGLLWVVLPYDLAFVGLTYRQLAHINPHLLPFMAHDRITVAGTMISIGVLYGQLALFGMRDGARWARRVVFISAAFGFASYLLWLGFGYFDPLHALATVLLFPLFVLGMRSRAQAPGALSSTPPNMGNDRRWFLGLWGQMLFVGLGVGLTVGGATIAYIGVTTVFVPQDLAFLRTSAAALRTINPHLVPLIAHDRAGLGGALVADGLGVLLTTLWGFRQGARWQWWTLVGTGMPGFAAALGIHVAIGYLDFWHLARAILAAAVYVIALALTYPYLCAPPHVSDDATAASAITAVPDALTGAARAVVTSVRPGAPARPRSPRADQK